jgi:predicted O-methyltransferase YrrM
VSERLRANLAVVVIGRYIALIRGLSADVLPELMVEGRRFDFIYIDGSHVAPDVLLDAAMSFALLKPGGILAFDDYDWSPGHLERAECLHRGGQAWFRKLATAG